MAAEEGVATMDVDQNVGNCDFSGSSLLIVIGEPGSEEHKDLVIEKLTKGLQSWDALASGIDINGALEEIAESSPTGIEGQNGERLIQHCTENLQVDILINPEIQTFHSKLRNLLKKNITYRHIVYAGHVFLGSGSWVLQDDRLSFSKFVSVFQETDISVAVKEQVDKILAITAFNEGDWNPSNFAKQAFGKVLEVRLNPGTKLESLNGVQQFCNYMSYFVNPTSVRDLLKASDVVGNIRFSRPTLYIFPGCQGDSALFGISGFNLLVNGGYGKKACFWDFTRHLDRIDALLLSHLAEDNLFGASSVLERKAQDNVHPELGFVYFNGLDDKQKNSPNGDCQPEDGGSHKPPSLLVDLVQEGNKMIENMKIISQAPHPCLGKNLGTTLQPINLYHKVGHGSLDMYVLNPLQDNKDMKEFFTQWGKQSGSFSSKNGIPLPHILSIAALLVWKPSSPSEKITRILFPGSVPQPKLFEGLDKLKTVDLFKHPECSEESLKAPPVPKSKKTPVAKVPPIQKASTPSRTPRKDKEATEAKESGRSTPDKRRPIAKPNGVKTTKTSKEPSKKIDKKVATKSGTDSDTKSTTSIETPPPVNDVASPAESTSTHDSALVVSEASTAEVDVPAKEPDITVSPKLEEKTVEEIKHEEPVNSVPTLAITPESDQPPVIDSSPVDAQHSTDSESPRAAMPESDQVMRDSSSPVEPSEPESEQHPPTQELLIEEPAPTMQQVPVDPFVLDHEKSPVVEQSPQVELPISELAEQEKLVEEQKIVEEPEELHVTESPDSLPDPEQYAQHGFENITESDPPKQTFDTSHDDEKDVDTSESIIHHEKEVLPDQDFMGIQKNGHDIESIETSSQEEASHEQVNDPVNLHSYDNVSDDNDVMPETVQEPIIPDKLNNVLEQMPDHEDDSAPQLIDIASEGHEEISVSKVTEEEKSVEHSPVDSTPDEPVIMQQSPKQYSEIPIMSGIAERESESDEASAQLEVRLEDDFSPREEEKQVVSTDHTSEISTGADHEHTSEVSAGADHEELSQKSDIDLEEIHTDIPATDVQEKSPDMEEDLMKEYLSKDVEQQQVLEESNKEPFDGEKPEGLPSPREPELCIDEPCDLVEPDTSKNVVVSETGHLAEEPVNVDNTVNVDNLGVNNTSIDEAKKFDMLTMETPDVSRTDDSVTPDKEKSLDEEESVLSQNLQSVSNSQVDESPDCATSMFDDLTEENKDVDLVTPEKEKSLVEESVLSENEKLQSVSNLQAEENPDGVKSIVDDLTEVNKDDITLDYDNQKDESLVEESVLSENKNLQSVSNLQAEESPDGVKSIVDDLTEVNKDDVTFDYDNQKDEFRQEGDLLEVESPLEKASPVSESHMDVPLSMKAFDSASEENNAAVTSDFEEDSKLKEDEINRHFGLSETDVYIKDTSESEQMEQATLSEGGIDIMRDSIENPSCLEPNSLNMSSDSLLDGNDKAEQGSKPSIENIFDAPSDISQPECSLSSPTNPFVGMSPNEPVETSSLENNERNIPFSADTPPSESIGNIETADTDSLNEVPQTQNLPYDPIHNQFEGMDPFQSLTSTVPKENATDKSIEDEFDPLKEWGQPMGLPSPAPTPGADKNKPKATKTSGKMATSKAPTSKTAGSKTKEGPTKSGSRLGSAPTPRGATDKDEKKATSSSSRMGTRKPASAPSTRPSAKENGTKTDVKKPPHKADDAKKTATSKRMSIGVRKAVPQKEESNKPESKPPGRGTPKPRPATVGASAKQEPASVKMIPVVPFYVDLAYIPHHGESSYMNLNYFRRVRAKYYVYSALQPDPVVIESLLTAKQTWDDPTLETTVIPTYDTDALRVWMSQNREKLSSSKVDIAPSASRCTIQLQDHETSCAAYRLEF